jgi:phosphotransferase system enzyme I (PtsI)
LNLGGSEEEEALIILKGVGVSPGIALGPAFYYESGRKKPPERSITEAQVPAEMDRLRQAVSATAQQLERIKERLWEELGEDFAKILDAHLLILRDRRFFHEALRLIQEERISAETGLTRVIQQLDQVFSRIEDQYLQERRADVNDVGQRVLQNLLGQSPISLDHLSAKAVILTHDLPPSEAALLNREKVLGLATEVGGRTSHSAIIARSMQIPALVGVEKIMGLVKTGDMVILDGSSGLVIIDPPPEMQIEYQEKQRQWLELQRNLEDIKTLEGETLGGKKINLAANIESAEELPAVKEYGAFGVGLYRTEFLYLNRRDLPNEEEHFNIYKTIAQGITPYTAVIRTLDLGGDKFTSQVKMAPEMNPSLGLRAIRLCLSNPELFFKPQLRAILRASAYGQLKVMFPMISGLEELRQAKALWEGVKAELDQESIPYDKKMEVGVMIETPSAAVIADLLAKEVDFFSIGTNDLIQYSLAIDRVNEQVAYLYEPLHPAILRLIKTITNCAHSNHIWVGMCGEMAGEPLFTMVLLGLGLDQLSMNPISIPAVKKIIRSVTYKEAKALAHDLLSFATPREVEAVVYQEMHQRFPQMFP